MLELAQDCPFARAWSTQGRLSVPSWLVDSPLNTPDSDGFAGNMVPGAPMDDAPTRRPDRLAAGRHGHADSPAFTTWKTPARWTPPGQTLAGLADHPMAVHAIVVAQTGWPPRRPGHADRRPGRAAETLRPAAGTSYLLRPDQHVAARWRQFDAAKVRAAVARATGNVRAPKRQP